MALDVNKFKKFDFTYDYSPDEFCPECRPEFKRVLGWAEIYGRDVWLCPDCFAIWVKAG